MEVASTVQAVMSNLDFKYPFRLVWQSKVGPLPWLSPSTDGAIRAYVQKGIRNFVVIPIAFVNEHIETLHELDIEYGHDLMKEVRSPFRQAFSLFYFEPNRCCCPLALSTDSLRLLL